MRRTRLNALVVLYSPPSSEEIEKVFGGQRGRRTLPKVGVRPGGEPARVEITEKELGVGLAGRGVGFGSPSTGNPMGPPATEYPAAR